MLEEDLFPVSLSVEERIRHWLFLFSHSMSANQNGFFTSAHEKALTAVLCQKKRYVAMGIGLEPGWIEAESKLKPEDIIVIEP